jgi:hypothetical protein
LATDETKDLATVNRCADRRDRVIAVIGPVMTRIVSKQGSPPKRDCVHEEFVSKKGCTPRFGDLGRSVEISGDLAGREGVAEIAGIAVIARDRRDRKARAPLTGGFREERSNVAKNPAFGKASQSVG